jgi:branched-subunit amino acid transport protein
MTVLAILLLGLITFLYRYSFVSSYGRLVAEKIPQDFLKLLAPATFTAIVMNNLLANHQHPLEFRQKVMVAVISLPVAYFTKSMVTTVIFGLGLLYVFQNYLF